MDSVDVEVVETFSVFVGRNVDSVDVEVSVKVLSL